MGTANFNGYTAKVPLGGLAAKATFGGGGGALNNDIPRVYASPETLPVELPPATVTTPQLFTIEYDDAIGTTWRLVKNTTAWKIMEKGQ